MSPCIHLVRSLLVLALVATVSAQIPQTTIPPLQPMLPSQPILQVNPLPLPPRPGFEFAAISESALANAVLELHGVTNIEEVSGLCSDPSGNHVCRLLKEGYFAEAAGVTAQLCRISSGAPTLLLTCRLSGSLNPANGSAVTVRLGRAGLPVVSTAITYTAYRCAPEISQITRNGNQFTLTGNDLLPPMPGVTRAIVVQEFAQGEPIATLPTSNAADISGGVRIIVEHPNLTNKILRFAITMSKCIGHRTATSRVVLTLPGQTQPSTQSGSAAEFRMPGASDANAALDVGGSGRFYDSGNNQTAQPFHIRIGESDMLEFSPVNRGAAITNVTIDFSATGPISLGNINPGTDGLAGLEMFVLGNFQNRLNLSCSTHAVRRYICVIANVPAGSGPYQLRIPVRGTGTAGGLAAVDFSAYGGGLTLQQRHVVINAQLDAANTADRAVTALSGVSGIVPGTSYTKSAFAQVQGHTARFTVANNGPAVLVPPVRASLTFTALPGDRFGWQYEIGALPAGCAMLQPGIPTVTCTMDQALAAGQTQEYLIPFTLRNHITVDGSTYPGFPNTVSVWPSCAPGCVPAYVGLMARITAAGPSLETNDTNNSIPAGPGSQAMPICAGGWQAVDPTSDGNFQRIRCIQ